jgi:hypothetical protein
MTFNPNVPQPNDLLSDSQVDILQNFSSSNTSFGINHYPFDDATINNGKHKFVQMPVQGSTPVIAAGDGALYTRTDGGESQLFYTPDATGNTYQITRCITASSGTFGTFTVFDGTQPRVTGGWTFLPGGLLMQYGILTSPVNNDTIKFPVAFNNFCLPTVTAIRSNTDDKTISVKTGSVTLSQFQIIMSGSSLPTGMYWHAIGK